MTYGYPYEFVNSRRCGREGEENRPRSATPPFATCMRPASPLRWQWSQWAGHGVAVCRRRPRVRCVSSHSGKVAWAQGTSAAGAAGAAACVSKSEDAPALNYTWTCWCYSAGELLQIEVGFPLLRAQRWTEAAVSPTAIEGAVV